MVHSRASWKSLFHPSSPAALPHFNPSWTFQEKRVCCLLLNIVVIQDESKIEMHWRTKGKPQGNFEVFGHFLSYWLRAVCVAISKSSMSQHKTQKDEKDSLKFTPEKLHRAHGQVAVDSWQMHRRSKENCSCLVYIDCIGCESGACHGWTQLTSTTPKNRCLSLCRV